MKKIALILSVFIHFFTFGESYLKIMYLRKSTSNCENQQQRCFDVRYNPTENWTVLKQNILGFEFQDGFEYCLLVDVNTISQKDSLLVEYTLNEIKYKIKTQDILSSPKINNIDTTEWLLYKLKTKDGTRTFTLQKSTMQLHSETNSIHGKMDCNTFTASFSADSTSLKLENIRTSVSYCGKHTFENDFLIALKNANRMTQKGNYLYLFKDKFLLLLFTKKK